MKRRVFDTEAELVQRAAEWLHRDGWETYFEVAPWGSGAARADIVATRGPLLAVVECKLSLSTALLEQCETWQRQANVVWAAVPHGNRRQFTVKIAGILGIGIVQLSSSTWTREQLVAPALNRRIHDKLRSSLTEAHKQTVPGAAGGYVTPFQETCTRLLLKVKEAGGRLPVKAAMTSLQHHYSSAACARSSLIGRTEAGLVPGLRLAREGRAVFFEVSR